MTSAPNIAAFATALIGQWCAVDALNGKGKGALGEWVEQQLRESEEGQRCDWAGRSESKADCQGLEIKVVVRHARRTPHALRYRLKEDMAISMINSAMLGTSFSESALKDKLNFLFVVVEKVGAAYVVQALESVCMQDWTVLETDFNRTASYYTEMCDKTSPEWAIDGLNHFTPGYGVALKSKTKGHRKEAGRPRSRAFYLRRAFLEKVLETVLR